MIAPIVGGIVLLYGLYRWDKSKKEHTVAQALTAPSGAPADAPPGAPAINYPAATTKLDPKLQTNNVIRYQAANPIPSGKTYYPTDGDKPANLIVRLSGGPKSQVEGTATATSAIVQTSDGKMVASLGKLNGFVAYNDLRDWINEKKPLSLPIGYNDIAGPSKNASGQIR